MTNNKSCSYCGSSVGRIYVYEEKYYCNKHFKHLYRHGKILERTRNDLNEILILKDHAEVVVYNRNCQENGRFFIDIDDIDKIRVFKWYMSESNYGKRYIACSNVNGKKTYIHHFITGFTYNKSVDLEVDHVNGDSLDNRKSNLRVVSHAQNNRNQRKNPSNNKSGIIGIFWDKQRHKWRSEIVVNRKSIYIGRFDNLDDAIFARKEAELKYFDKDKVVNFE